MWLALIYESFRFEEIQVLANKNVICLSLPFSEGDSFWSVQSLSTEMLQSDQNIPVQV